MHVINARDISPADSTKKGKLTTKILSNVSYVYNILNHFLRYLYASKVGELAKKPCPIQGRFTLESC